MGTNRLVNSMWRVLVLMVSLGLPAAAQYTITTIAGGNPTSVLATSVSLSALGVGYQSFPSPVLYVSTVDNRVYKVDANGVLSVFAGNGAVGISGDGEEATQAELTGPGPASADSNGNVYFTDGGVGAFGRVRKVDTNGILTTFYTTGTGQFLEGIALDGLGAMYVGLIPEDVFAAAEIVKLDLASGNTLATFTVTQAEPFTVEQEKLGSMAVDSAGALYVIYQTLVLKLVGSSFVTMAGNGTSTYVEGANATSTGFNGPRGLAVANSGTAAIVYVVDGAGAGYIRKIAGGVVTTVAGNSTGIASGDNGPALGAGFSSVRDIATDSSGSLYIADVGSYSVRKIANGIITTFAGGGAGDDESAASAILTQPQSCAVNASTRTLYIADGISRIRQVAGGVISTAAGATAVGYSGDGPAPATASLLNQPLGIAVDSGGNLYIADYGNFRIRKVTPAGIMTTIAGNGASTYSGDGNALQTGLLEPAGVAVDGAGNVYELDGYSPGLVHKITGGTITTLSGSASDSLGIAVNASDTVFLANPVSLGNGGVQQGVVKLSGGSLIPVVYPFLEVTALAFDSAGSLYIADAGYNQVFKFANGVLTVVAGNGTPGFSGDGGPASAAQLNSPSGLAVDSSGNVYISDFFNSRVRVAIPQPQTAPGTLLSLSPNSAAVGAPAFTITISGTGFTNGNVVLWNGSPIPTTFFNPSKLTATVSAALLSTAGPSSVSVGASNALLFYVQAPTISYLTPVNYQGSANGCGTDANSSNNELLTFAGSGFISGVSTVHFAGMPVTTTFVSSTQLTACVLQAQLSGWGGQTLVSVFNLTQSSNEVTFKSGPAPMVCTANGGVPPTLRVGGEAELIGNLLIGCAVAPDDQNQYTPQDITVFPGNFNFTSRILNTTTGATEALLLVGEPAPESQVLGTNVFQGYLAGPNIVFPGVPFAFTPGVTTNLRIVNLRANTLDFGLGISQAQNALVTVSLGSIPLIDAVQTLGFVEPTSFQAATVYSAANLRSVQLNFAEKFANAFRIRVASGGAQDVPGMAYNTESGFVNPALLATAGLADSGTRLLVQLSGVPAGVNVYAAIYSDDGSAAKMVSTDSNGVGPESSFPASSSMFGGTYAPVTVSNGIAVAVWEVVSPSAPGTLSFHVVLTGMTQTGLGPISLEGSPAPLSPVSTATATDPVPRFAANSLTGFVDMTLLSSSATATRVSGSQAAVVLKSNPTMAAYRGNSTRSPSIVSHAGAGSTYAPIQAGSNLPVGFNLLNQSPGPTTNVTVSSNVPSQLTVQAGSCTAPGGTCSTVANADGSTQVTGVYPGPVQPGDAPAFSFTTTACNSANSCVNSTGTVSTTVTSSNANQQPTDDSFPDDNSYDNSFVITSTAPPPVTVQFATIPANLTLQVGLGGQAQTNSSVQIPQSGSLSFSVTSPQSGSAGSQYVFANWSDGSTSASRSGVPVPLGGGTFTANFNTQYQLNVTASTGGSVALTPAGGFYAPDAPVQIDAAAAPGYVFSGYTGDFPSVSTPVQLVMPQNAIHLTANFLPMPTPGAVTPRSGSGVSQTFTFVYSDASGALDLASAQALFNTAINGTGSCYVWVTPASGAVWLAADNGGWPAQSTLGKAGTLQNSQCILNVGASSGTLSGNTYTLSLSLTFQAGYAGMQNIYSYATSQAGLISGWQTVGTWTVLVAPPQAVSVTPSSGSGASQTFTFVYTDSKGAADLSTAQALFNTSSPTGIGGCYVWVTPASGAVWLANDNGTTWPAAMTLGTGGTEQNSQCTLNVAASSGTLSGNTYTLHLAIGFRAGFAGAKNVYGYASTQAGLTSGWQSLGTWMVPATPPQAVSVSPSSGSGASQTFTFVYTDVNGASDLASAQALISTTITGFSSCYVWVTPGTGAVWLAGDAETWTASLPLGTAGTLQNSQCVVNVGSSSGALSGNTYTLNLAIAFQSGFSGAKNIYGLATSLAGVSSGWQTEGTWNAGQPVQAASVSPASGSGASHTFTFVYTDSKGASDLASAQALIGSSISGVSSCYVWVTPGTGAIWLAGDAETWPAAMTLGTAGMLQNSQCILNVGASSGALSGNTYTLNLALAFQNIYAGAKNVYGYASTQSGLNSGWQTVGTWTVPVDLTPQPVSVSPSSGSGASQTFTLVYTDGKGASDLASAQVIVNTGAIASSSCYVYVTPGTGAVWLAADNGSWPSQGVLGTTGTQQNSQCALNAGGSSGTLSGDTYTLHLAITFESGFAGSKNIFMYAAGSSGESGWQDMGSWTPH